MHVCESKGPGYGEYRCVLVCSVFSFELFALDVDFEADRLVIFLRAVARRPVRSTPPPATRAAGAVRHARAAPMPIAQPGLAELQRLCDESSAAPLLLLLTCSAHPRCNEAARVEALYSLETAALNYSSGSLRFARTEGADFPLSALNLRGTDLPAMVLFNAPSTHVHSQAVVAEGGGWRPEAVAHFVEAARKGAAPPFVRSEAAPPLSLSARALQTASAASLAEARTSMRQIVLLLHEPRGRRHRHLVRVS